ncbi:hypothetical protein D1007_36426 [Hordeum vulgare]|nr:hypothetical protein D1007_36426 [Hordeum vulgare]
MRYHINLFLSLPVGSLESLDLHGEASSSEAAAAEADALDLHHCRTGAAALGQAPHGVAGPVSSSYGPTAPGAAPRDAEALHRRAAPAAVESSTRLLMERPPRRGTQGDGVRSTPGPHPCDATARRLKAPW